MSSSVLNDERQASIAGEGDLELRLARARQHSTSFRFSGVFELFVGGALQRRSMEGIKGGADPDLRL